MHLDNLLKYQKKGNGVIIITDNKFLFVVGNEKYWDKSSEPWTITYTNTGGHVEPGESIIDATKREVLEEIDCEVELLPSDETLYCTLENPELSVHELADHISPILVYNSEVMEMSVCVYLGCITDDPRPSREIPAILLLPPALIDGGPLSSLLASGVILIEQEEGIIPRNTLLKPFGSARIIAENWNRIASLMNLNLTLNNR